MLHLLDRSPSSAIPLRPLLYAAGAAVTAAGVYYMRNRGDGESTAEHAQKSHSFDPLHDSLLDPGSMCDVHGVGDPQTVSAVPAEDSPAEVDWLYVAQLENEKSKLMSKVNSLQGTVQELGSLLCETHMACIEATKMYEVELTLHKHVQAEYDKLDEKYDQKIESIRGTLTESERKYDEVMESNAKLEVDLKILQDTMLELDEELSKTRTKCNELTRACEDKDRELSILQSEYNEIKETLLKTCEGESEVHCMLLSQKEDLKKLLYQKEELMKVTVAEAQRKFEQVMKKYEKVVESNNQLENEKSDLMSQVNTLQGTVQQLEEELSGTCSKCEQLKREREQEADKIQKQFSHMLLTHNEWSLHVTEAEMKSKQEKLSNSQVEAEKLVLMDRVKTLQNSVHALTNLLSKTHKKCYEAMRECVIAKSIQKFVKFQAKKRVKFFMQKNTSLQESLAEVRSNNQHVMKRYEEAMRLNSQLENENADLLSNLESVQNSMTIVENELSEALRKCEETTGECKQKDQELSKRDFLLKSMSNSILMDYEKECLAHGNLKAQYYEMKQQHEELLKDRERAREAYNILQSQYEETLKQHNELILECERGREAHSILKLQYNQMKENRSSSKESQSERDREQDSHRKRMETLKQCKE